MLDILSSIDTGVFYFINQTISVKFLDKFFLTITEVKNWYIAYVILWLTLLIKGGNKGRIAAIGALLLVAASDQISSQLIKNLFERARPCHVLENVRLLVSCKNSFSFPSSHAVNNFAIAVFFLRLYPNYKWPLLVTASLVALSRPYIGVHYPSDILAGALLGSIIGYVFSLIALRFEDYLTKKRQNNIPKG